jgi:ubiquinone/menaquinone biosynthesis C-methylase UbiE
MNEPTITEEHAAPPEAWDAIATGYDRYVAPQETDLANEALRLVGVEPGERFLDVAAGTGGLSLPAARLGAQVLATDWSAAMIERFEHRVRDENLSQADGRVMDCHALDLPDASFDVTGSQFGVMLVPDQPRSLREMVRVTKPGGRVLVIAYGFPAELEFLQFPRRTEGRRPPSSPTYRTIHHRSNSRFPTPKSCAGA